jgi:DNA-binding transcriptional ArsR family regulator
VSRGVDPWDADARAGAVFEALADATRRALLRDVVTQGPRTATELAANLPITRQAVAKHLAVLREAGLVEHERAGREARFTATLGPLAEAEGWLRTTGASWDDRLARLQQLALGRDGADRRE